jgi:hypothetical protein
MVNISPNNVAGFTGGMGLPLQSVENDGGTGIQLNRTPATAAGRLRIPFNGTSGGSAWW